MASPEAGLPDTFHLGEFDWSSRRDRPGKARPDVKWIAKLGSQSYGNPTVANGRVYVGTNNDSPRDPRFTGDRSAIYCLDEKTRRAHLAAQHPQARHRQGLRLGVPRDLLLALRRRRSRLRRSPTAARSLCLDVDGPGQRQPRLRGRGALPGLARARRRSRSSASDGDILWIFNMIDECGVFPHNITSSAILVDRRPPVGHDLQRRRLRPRRDARALRAELDRARQAHRQAARRGGLGPLAAHLPLQLVVAGLPRRPRSSSTASSAAPTGVCTPSAPSRSRTRTATRCWPRPGASTPTSPSTASRTASRAQVRHARGPERGARPRR